MDNLVMRRNTPEQDLVARERDYARRQSPEYKARARERAKAWYQGNAERTEHKRQASRAWYEANREYALEHAKAYQADRDPAKGRATWIKSKYQLTDEQYQHILDHCGECDACGRSDVPLQIDHDHDTDAYRGQLCGGCNRAAGMLRDDPAAALGLHHYLLERASHAQ